MFPPRVGYCFAHAVRSIASQVDDATRKEKADDPDDPAASRAAAPVLPQAADLTSQPEAGMVDASVEVASAVVAPTVQRGSASGAQEPKVGILGGSE